MKKLLTTLAALLALGLLAFGVGSLRWHPSRRDAPPRLEKMARGGGPLLAGAATVPLTPAPPVPVAGFPRLLWMEEGRRDPVAVRALVLQEHGCTVALVSAEILLVPGKLEQAVARAVLDLKLDHLVLAATHTHAGPGGYWQFEIGERFATGPYSEAAFEHLVQRASEAIRKAAGALEPAYLSVGRGRVTDLVRNRGGGVADGRLVSARLVALTGRPLAEVVLYPSHATLLGGANRLVSGDWPGALMRSRPEPVLLFQGAVGDQTPLMPPGQRANPEIYAQALRQRIEELQYSAPDPWPELAVATSTAVLPAPIPGATPPLLRRLAANVFYDWLPDRALLTAVRLGPLTLIAVPGEPVAAVGERWRAAAGRGGEIVALAGDYLGYVETSERMAEAAGETVHTYYGPELADRLAGAIQLSAAAVNEGEAGEAASAARARGLQERRDASQTRVSPFSNPALGGSGGSGARSPQSEVERSSTGDHSDSPVPTFHKHGTQRKASQTR